MEEIGGKVNGTKGKVEGIEGKVDGIRDMKESEEWKLDGSNSNILGSTLRLTGIIIIFHKIWYFNTNKTLHPKLSGTCKVL